MPLPFVVKALKDLEWNNNSKSVCTVLQSVVHMPYLDFRTEEILSSETNNFYPVKQATNCVDLCVSTAQIEDIAGPN